MIKGVDVQGRGRWVSRVLVEDSLNQKERKDKRSQCRNEISARLQDLGITETKAKCPCKRYSELPSVCIKRERL